ncbi:MAG: hypothetical protein AAB654_02905, partial [Acidobacteriota bacterium]
SGWAGRTRGRGRSSVPGTLLATAEAFVNRSPRSYFAEELARVLYVEVRDALHQLVERAPSGTAHRSW